MYPVGVTTTDAAETSAIAKFALTVVVVSETVHLYATACSSAKDKAKR